MSATAVNVPVHIVKGQFAGNVGVAFQTFGKQSVAVRGMGTVYRRSLSVQSRRDLLAAEAGVTWAWLREAMSAAEADEWLAA